MRDIPFVAKCTLTNIISVDSDYVGILCVVLELENYNDEL